MEEAFENLNKNIENIENEIIKKICVEQIECLDKVEVYCEEKFAELNALKTDLEAKKSSARGVFEKSKARLDSLEEIKSAGKNESSRLRSEFEVLDNDHKGLVAKYEELEEKCHEVKSKLNISPQDQQTLDSDKKKFELYKEATNIVWDYSIPIDSTISGFVRNKDKGYLESFEFRKDEVSAEQAQEKLWEEIEKGIQDQSEENQENVPCNK